MKMTQKLLLPEQKAYGWLRNIFSLFQWHSRSKNQTDEWNKSITELNSIRKWIIRYNES